jgi:transposase
MRRKGTVEQLAEQRARGLALVKQGKKAKEVAEILNVTSRSVNRWMQDAKKPKRRKKPKPIGRHRKLTEAQVKRLGKALKRGAPAYGYSGDYWTLDRISQVIWQVFEVRYHPSSVWHVLNRMGWSSQRPQRRAFQRNEEAVEQWKQEILPKVKKKSETEGGTGP